MAWTASLVLLAVAVLGIGGVLLSWRRRSRAASGVRLYEIMRLRGVSPPRPRDAAAAHDFAAAQRRCVACSSMQLCDELLRAGGADKSYRLFCPNALYVEWLRSNSLHFD